MCDRSGSSDCADEVILAGKAAKSRRRISGLRSKTTKARSHVERLRAANADLKKRLAEALEQQAATSDVLQVENGDDRELRCDRGGADVIARFHHFHTMVGQATRENRRIREPLANPRLMCFPLPLFAAP